MEQQHNEEVPERGLRRNAIGLSGLIAQSLGVTAPEISAVVIAGVVAAKVAGATPFVFIIAGIGALGLAITYGRFARHVPNAGGTYAIVRAGLGRDAGFMSGWVVLAVGVVFVRPCWCRSGSCCRTSSGSVAPARDVPVVQLDLLGRARRGLRVRLLVLRGADLRARAADADRDRRDDADDLRHHHPRQGRRARVAWSSFGPKGN